MRKIAKIGLTAVGTMSLLSSLISFGLFKILYLACPEEFNSEGRCFDPVEGVVYHDGSFFWLPIGLSLLMGAGSLLLLSRVVHPRRKSSSAS